jgi:hypothetical protein
VNPTPLRDWIRLLGDTTLIFKLLLLAEDLIDGEGAGAFHHNQEADGEDEQMVLVAFAFLRAVPVHEEADGEMDLYDCNDHDAGDAEGGDAAEQADDEAESTEELREDGDGGEDGGNTEQRRHEVHGAAESVAPEPAEYLLRAVDEEDDAENQPADGKRYVIGCCDDWSHSVPPRESCVTE